MMGAPNIETDVCPFYGWNYGYEHCPNFQKGTMARIERHHIVPRSQGGQDGPTITVCGWGNMAHCHKLLHQHVIHLHWTGDEWLWVMTPPCKHEKALQFSGWSPIAERIEVIGE